MTDRGQITGGVLDGPLVFDNAIDLEVAKIKGIKSEVAGRTQNLVVPDLEAGNMLAEPCLLREGGWDWSGARSESANRAYLARGFRRASRAIAALHADARRVATAA
jgi:phosphate acetyltransferase